MNTESQSGGGISSTKRTDEKIQPSLDHLLKKKSFQPSSSHIVPNVFLL